MSRACLLAAALVLWALPAFAQPAAPDPDELLIARLLQRIETALAANDRAAWLSLISVNADADAAGEFFDATVPRAVTRAVVHERDRHALDGALPGDGYQLIVEVFLESGPRGQLGTWRLDIKRPSGAGADELGETPWRVLSQERLSQVDTLHRLALNPQRMFQARDFVLTSVDYELKLTTGSVFVADTAEGVTAAVLIGDGLMTFHPTPKTEQGQVRLFSGEDKVESRFDAAFVRVNPFDFAPLLAGDALTAAPVDGRQLVRAREIFDEDVARSFSLDLSDLSRDTWSILPQPGDIIAEVRTRRYRTLTYARASGEAEDVTFFNREKKKNISVYASPQKLASRGAFYDEDDLTEYDILDHQIDLEVFPDRDWIVGTSTIKLRVKAFVLGALNLKLAETLTVSSITSKELGRLLFLRVRNQSAIVVNLPTPVSHDYELTLTVQYQGRMERQKIDAESIDLQESRPVLRPEDSPIIAAEPNWLFSNRAAWYPQSPVTDYATASLRVAAPAEFMVAASGLPESTEPAMLPPLPGGPLRRLFSYTSMYPVRYLGVVVSRMTRVDAATVALDIVPPPSAPAPKSISIKDLFAAPKPAAIGTRNTIELVTMGNRRQESRARDALPVAADILRFYASLMGDVPFPSFTIAMLESELPGGHSPPFFAVLNNPLPAAPFVWRNDPAVFSDFPEFVMAHEIAHQWWGQAVGWKNYHEQWISEGFAQYFATLYAREKRGDATYRSAIRNLRRWSQAQSDQGPIALGYRLGHIKGESRVFRALVYNKGAAVLHMLRRFIGDEAFLKGLRGFYGEFRYRKAGTDDLRVAMEKASGQPLERFFERWVLDSTLPRVRYATTVQSGTVDVAYEQTGDVFDLPVTVTLHYADGTSEDLVARFTEASGTVTLPARAAVRNVELNRDDLALGTFDRR